jgi:hypothetical protein
VPALDLTYWAGTAREGPSEVSNRAGHPASVTRRVRSATGPGSVLRLPRCSFGTHELYVRLTGMLPQAHFIVFAGFLRMGLNAATRNP